MTLKVSTVVPVYNGVRWLAATVESLANQTYEDHEILLVDDGSTDGSAELMEQLAEHPKVIALGQANGGVAAARNTGIRASTGDLIAFCDQDDLWLPEKLEKQIPLFTSTTGLVYSGVEFRYTDRSRLAIPAGEAASFKSLLANNSICSCSAIARRGELEQIGLLEEDRALMGVDDWHLWLRMTVVTGSAYVPEVLAVHVVHDNNYSSRERAMLDASLACLARLADDPAISAETTDFDSAREKVYRHYAQNFIHYGEFAEARSCLQELAKLSPRAKDWFRLKFYSALPDQVLLRMQMLKRLFPGS